MFLFQDMGDTKDGVANQGFIDDEVSAAKVTESLSHPHRRPTPHPLTNERGSHAPQSSTASVKVYRVPPC